MTYDRTSPPLPTPQQSEWDRSILKFKRWAKSVGLNPRHVMPYADIPEDVLPGANRLNVCRPRPEGDLDVKKRVRVVVTDVPAFLVGLLPPAGSVCHVIVDTGDCLYVAYDGHIYVDDDWLRMAKGRSIIDFVEKTEKQ